MNGRIVEIFSSLQGEGLWVGRPQVFVRFQGCKLKCGYCDTPLTHAKIDKARIEYPPFSKTFEPHTLEFSVDEINSTMARFGIPSLAVTGGEPLEQVDFLEEWFKTLTDRMEILLETSGVETEALKRVIGFLSMVSLDIKIPSATGEKPLWDIHDNFIKVARQKPAYAKIIFDERITDDEIENLMILFKKHPFLSFIFQPVSPLQKRDFKKIFQIFQLFAKKFPTQVRLIPQVHKFLSIL